MNSTLHEKVAISREDYLVLLSLDYSFNFVNFVNFVYPRWKEFPYQASQAR